jgi:energy-coupling factor transporter transmembrane protein EcfT
MTAQGMSTGREGKEYVRTFLFSMKIGSPLARLHILTKVTGVLLLSFIVVRLMNMQNPDPLGTAILTVFSLTTLFLGGVIIWLIRSYLLVLFPMLGTLLITWLIFNPDPGNQLFLRLSLYGGVINLGLSLGFIAFVASTLVCFLLTRRIFWGVMVGLALAISLSRLGLNPTLDLASFTFFRPIDLVISDKNLIVAVTKMLGYATMVFLSLTLIMTTRDAEVIGLFHQTRVPHAVSFFTSVMLRSLSIAFLDYGTIRQAQVARGANIQEKSIFARILDLARISVPLIATMIRRSTEIGDAVMARGMTRLSKETTSFREIRPVRTIDMILILFLLGLLIAVVGLNLNFSGLILMDYVAP